MQTDGPKYKIILLYPYFGKLPWYFSLFVHSCRHNPDIDFLIMSDHRLEMQLPLNVRVIKLTLNQFQKLSTEKLKCKVSVDPVPYKFCDLRPAFGVIFNDLIKGYEFWGHGDIDVIFGDIRKFITDDILNIHDMLFVRHDYVSSWFSLYKNCDDINNLFRLSKDYLKVFETPRYFNFDETNFAFSEFNSDLNYLYVTSEVESMTHLIKRLTQAFTIKPYFDLHAVEGLTGCIRWEKGKLTFKKEYEIILYHLLQFKKVYRPNKLLTSGFGPEKFRVTKTKILF